MYGFFTFFHIIGVIVWLGLLISLAILLPMLKNQLDTVRGKEFVHKVIYTFNAMAHTSAIIVLISGNYRIFQIDFENTPKPFWLHYMELVGWFIVLLGILSMEVLGRRVTILLSSQINNSVLKVASKRLSVYVVSVVLIMMLMISVVLVVSFRL